MTTEALHSKINEDCTLAVTAFGDKIQIIDLVGLKAGSKVTINGNINDIAIAGTNLYTVTNRDTLTVTEGNETKEIKLPEEATALAVHDGVAYIGTKRGNFLVIDLATNQVKSTVTISGSKITRICIGAIKKLVGIGSANGNLSVYSICESKMLSTDLKYHNLPITAIQFMHDDSRCVTGAHQRDLHYWDMDKLTHIDAIASKLPITRCRQDRRHLAVRGWLEFRGWMSFWRHQAIRC